MKKLFILLLVLIMTGCTTDKNNEKNEESLYLPVVHTKDNQLGYINAKDGKIVIEPQFAFRDKAMSFDSNHQYTIIFEDSSWKMIDDQGKVTFDASKQKNNYTLVSQFFVDGNVYAYDENNQHVKISGDGTVTSTEYYPYSGLYDISVQNSKLMCYCKENDDHYYALDSKQKVIFKSKYPFVFKTDIYDENIGICYIHTEKDGTTYDKYDFYYIDNKGNKLLDGKVFDGADVFTEKGYAYVSNADISYITDNVGDIIHTSRTGEMKPCIIDKDGKEVYVLKDREKACLTNKDYYICYYEEAKCGIKDSQGKVVIEPNYDDIVIYGDCFMAHDSKTYDLYHTDGKAIKSFKDVDSLEVVNQYIIINNQYIYDFEGKELVNVKEVNKNLQIKIHTQNLVE